MNKVCCRYRNDNHASQLFIISLVYTAHNIMSLTSCQLRKMKLLSENIENMAYYFNFSEKILFLTRIWSKCRVFLLFFAFCIYSVQPASAGLIRDSELETGFEDIVHDMAAQAGFADGINIRIIIDPSYNAFVRGGQTIYLHSGLLLSATSAEEIYGVIAHEIGHLAAGHVPLRSETSQQAALANALTAVASAAAAAAGSVDAAIGVAIGGTDRSNRLYLQKSRADESVADEWAIRLLNTQNITTAGLADFMRRMAAQRALPENRQAEYYLSHPGARQRLAAFSDNMAQTGNVAQNLPADIQRHMARLVTKLRAYVLPPMSVLKTPVDVGWPAFEPSPKISDYAIAIAHYRRGNLKEASQMMDRLSSEYPQDSWFHEFAGDVLVSDAELALAAEAFGRALALRPDAALIKLSKARALTALNQPDSLSESISLLEEITETENNWAFVWRQLAISYGRNQQLAQADLALAQEALLIGDTARAIQLANRSLSHQDVPEATATRARDILFELNSVPAQTR